ncbi:MAG TPA: twin-arginine translocation signal domain-containing protein, partial [Acidobacteriota bacterium]|nr:twin-arginine translocation signal domain-containing protein [Acidobacteriota bacterium]
MNRRDFFKRTGLGGAALTIGSPSVVRTIYAQAGESFRAGFAERDITPEIGMEKPGGYGKVFLDRFHDPCKVRIAVFENGRQTVALVGTDSLIIPRHLVLEARQEIYDRCGIDPNAILVGASHSHSSGPVGMVQPGEYDHASELVQKLAYEKSSCADPKYLDLVRRQIVDGVCAAYSSRREARCGVGLGHEDKVAFNRRFRMKNGLSYTH